jgi:hypothetical protein
MTGIGRGRWLHNMHTVLVAEVGSAEQFAEASRGWFEGVLQEMIPELYADLRARPVTGRATTSARVPLGQPSHVRGLLLTARERLEWRRSLYSERSWPRFLARLGEYPAYAGIDITPLDGQGQPVDHIWGYTTVSVERDHLVPQWACFSVGVPAVFTGWPDSPRLQQRWAGFVRGQAAAIGACAGGMSDDNGVGPSETSLEYSLQAQRSMQLSWGGAREELRGYWWVTIVPRELAVMLGGADRLAATGAFCEADSLPDGSVWLRATPAVNEFTGDRVRGVFEALAPVLPAGVTKFPHYAEYRIVEGVDAADFR